jgi:energy-coupling factor transporter ATP-binding protein EcfA2
MPVTQVRSNGNVLAEIVSWSAQLPAWQQDGLRRVIEDCSLSSQDIDELTQLCKKEHGSGDTLLTARILGQEAIPKGSAIAQVVTLRSIADPEHVNSLESKQELTFGEHGLTVIFGHNGSGKSGYGRILRRACRSRQKGTAILPNVMSNGATGPASAVITYALGGVEQKPEQWIDEQRPVEALGSISFFDAQCATIHVSEKNGIAFTPLGLDVLPKLGAVCKDVQSRLDKERKIFEDFRPRFLQSTTATSDTTVGKLLKSLSHDSSIEMLESLASLTEDDRRRQQELTVLLANDGTKQGLVIRNSARRLLALKEKLGKGLTSLSASSVDSLRLLAADYSTKSKAAETAAKVSFSNDPLSGIGEPVWRELWEAARKYSALAYPNLAYPAVDGDDSVCVLCQQTLTADGKDRLSRFERFVADDTAKMAAEANAALNQAVERVAILGLRDKILNEQLEELRATSPETLAGARSMFANLIRQARAIRRAHQTGEWTVVRGATAADIVPAIQGIIDTLNSQAQEAERLVDDGERETLEAELAELNARAWLSTMLGDVKEHVTRLSKLHELNNCIDGAKTHKITAKSKALAKVHVTDQLRNAFASELQHMQLGVRRLKVELNAVAGEFGSSYYRVQLVGATNAKIGLIVSEGEHRCIALAGFLAELATEACKSAVVFDDPVTSLDHLWRERFAQRLAEESGGRQVVVFTHDIVFLHDMIAQAERQKVPVTIRFIQAKQQDCGYVSDELPWKAQKTLHRIDGLEKSARATQNDFDAHNDEKYEQAIYEVYDKLRATVERAVEEWFFRGMVVRYRDYIDLGELHVITGITLVHCERAQRLFKRCCEMTPSHDRAMARSFMELSA